MDTTTRPAARPDPTTATAMQTAGWYAAQALQLTGRADHLQAHNRADATADHLVALAAAHAATATALYALAINADPDRAARHLLTAAEAGDATVETSTAIATAAGLDPAAAYQAGQGELKESTR